VTTETNLEFVRLCLTHVYTKFENISFIRFGADRYLLFKLTGGQRENILIERHI